MPRVLSFLLLAGTLCAQSVISTRSGLMHYWEGVIALEGEPLSTASARFREIPEGRSLDTRDGRAEILLTPGVVLWAAPHTVLRMLRNSPLDTRVEVVTGRVLIHARSLADEDAVTILTAAGALPLNHPGVYRVESQPGDALDLWAAQREEALRRALSSPHAAPAHARRATGPLRAGRPF